MKPKRRPASRKRKTVRGSGGNIPAAASSEIALQHRTDQARVAGQFLAPVDDEVLDVLAEFTHLFLRSQLALADLEDSGRREPISRNSPPGARRPASSARCPRLGRRGSDRSYPRTRSFASSNTCSTPSERSSSRFSSDRRSRRFRRPRVARPGLRRARLRPHRHESALARRGESCQVLEREGRREVRYRQRHRIVEARPAGRRATSRASAST